MLVRALQRLENAVPRVHYSPRSSVFSCAALGSSTVSGRSQLRRTDTRRSLHYLRSHTFNAVPQNTAKCSPGDFCYPPSLSWDRTIQLSEPGAFAYSTRGYATAAGSGTGAAKGKKRGRPRKEVAATEESSENTDAVTPKRGRKSKKAKEKEARELAHVLAVRRNEALLAVIGDTIKHDLALELKERDQKKDSSLPRSFVTGSDVRRQTELIDSLCDVFSHHPAENAVQNRKPKKRKLRECKKKDSIDAVDEEKELASALPSGGRPICEADLRRTHALISTLYDILSYRPRARIPGVPASERTPEEQMVGESELPQTDAPASTIDDSSPGSDPALLRRSEPSLGHDPISLPSASGVKRLRQAHTTKENGRFACPETLGTTEDTATDFDNVRNRAFLSDLQSVIASPPHSPSYRGVSSVDERQNTALLSTLQSVVSGPSEGILPCTPPVPNLNQCAGSSADIRRQVDLISTLQSVLSKPSDPFIHQYIPPYLPPSRHDLKPDLARNEALISTLQSAISNPISSNPSRPSSVDYSQSSDEGFDTIQQNDAFISVLQSVISTGLPSTPHGQVQTSATESSAVRNNDRLVYVIQPVISNYSNPASQPHLTSPPPEVPQEKESSSAEHLSKLEGLHGNNDTSTSATEEGSPADVRRQTAFLKDIALVLSGGSVATTSLPGSNQPLQSSPSPEFETIDSGSATPPVEQDDEPPDELQRTLSDHSSHEFSRVWELYELAGSPPSLASRVLAYQCRAREADDLLRCSILFDTIQHPSERDYLNITRALLKDENSVAGGSQAIVKLCRQARQEDKVGKCFHSSFFMHIVKKDWKTARQLWKYKPAEIGRKKQFETVWKLYPKAMLEIPERILDIIDDIEKGEVKLVGSLEPVLSFLVFSVVSSKRLMGSVPTDTILSIFDRLWDLSILDIRHYFWAFVTSQQIDREEGSARSMLLYRTYRDRFPGVKVPETTMMGFFVTLSHLEIPNGIYTLLEDYRRFYGKPSYYAYLHALHVFSRNGRVADCEKLFKMYIKDHGKPKDLQIVTPLVNAYGVLGKVDDVKRQMEVMKKDYKLKPDAAVWNILLKAHAANDDTLGAFWVVERMYRAGVQADVRTFTTLLNMLARRGDFSTLLDVFEKFRELDIDIDRPLMKPVVAALCESESYTAAEALTERVTKLNLRGSPTPLWNVLLSKFASIPDVYALRRVHAKMISLGVVPDNMTYGALILALTMSGRTSSAVLILERLHRSRRLHATEFHYALLLLGYVREQNRDMVHVIYNEIKARFGHPGVSANLSALKSHIARDLQLFSEQGGDDYREELVLYHAEQFLDTIMKESSVEDIVLKGPQPGTLRRSTKESYPILFYEAMMEAYAKHGEVDRVSELFEKLGEKQHQLRPYDIHATPQIFRVLMIAHLRAEDHEAVASCWESLYKGMKLLATPVPESPSNITQPIIPAYKFSLSYCISLYMRSLASQNEYAQIKTLISDLEGAGFGLTTDNWSLYIKLLALSEEPEDQLSAFRLFEKLFIRNFPGWREIIRGYAKRPPDAPPSIDLLEDRTYNIRGKPFRVLGKKGRRAWAKIRPDYMQPTYSTMVYLASAYLSFQARAVVDGGAELSKLGEVGPRTLMTLGDMPVLNERFQKTLLKGQAPLGRAPPEEPDAKSPVWEGGVLGPGGRRADTSPLELTSSDGKLIPRKNRPYLRPLMQFTSEPDEEDMMLIFDEDKKWRETVRERILEPRESRDTDEIVRREDELDVEDERLYDIYPYDEKKFMSEQYLRRNDSTQRDSASVRSMPTPGGVKAIETRLKRRRPRSSS